MFQGIYAVIGKIGEVLCGGGARPYLIGALGVYFKATGGRYVRESEGWESRDTRKQEASPSA